MSRSTPTATTIAALLLLCLSYVSGKGTFIPAHQIPGAMTPGAAAGVEDEKSGFVKVAQRKNVTKWTQTIEGIPVYGSVLTTHNDERGEIKRVQGFVSQTASLVDIKPNIDDRAAIDLVTRKWSHSQTDPSLEFRLDKPQLEILQSDDGWDKLIWKVSYFVSWRDSAVRKDGIGPVPAYISGLVNAHTSDIERTWNNIQSATIPAIFGNSNIGKRFHDIDVHKQSKKSKRCYHKDSSRRVEVFDMRNRVQVSSKVKSKFKCTKADEENWDKYSETGGYSPRNEAFLYATQFVDMWRDLASEHLEPYETTSSYLRFYVHYDSQYDNAFFDGDSFKFGDGYEVFYPLTALDVICHEVGHAVTQWNGGNMEYWRQSGGMNEAYSDVVGATCNHYYKKRTDGKIGADIMRPGTNYGEFLRDMCNPHATGAIDHMDQYNDNVDVHYSSGIYNKAWCRLILTDGWDYIKAFEIFTDANMLYWTPTSTFHCGACGVESAAEDRGYKRADVTAAFDAVGVSCGRCQS